MFLLLGDSENWPRGRAFFMDQFRRVVYYGKTGREIIFFLELRLPYRVWFMMAWYFEPERQKLRWCLTNMIYTIVDTHYTRCEHSIIFYTFSVARSASYYLLQQGWIFLQLAIFMSLNLSITSAKYWVKITALTLTRQNRNFYTNFQRIKIHK